MKCWSVAILLVPLLSVPAYAAGDPAVGATVFNKCKACHAAGPGATNRVGPVLNDVVGRVAGTFAGYSYSDALKAAGAAGLVWTPDVLAKWLAKPKDLVPATKMSFPGLTDQADIDNVMAYLVSMSPNYKPADGAAAPAASSSSAAQ